MSLLTDINETTGQISDAIDTVKWVKSNKIEILLIVFLTMVFASVVAIYVMRK